MDEREPLWPGQSSITCIPQGAAVRPVEDIDDSVCKRILGCFDDELMGL